MSFGPRPGLERYTRAPKANHQTNLKQAAKPHPRHFYTEGMVEIRIEDTLFRVPRLGLTSYSEPFALLLKEHDEHASNCDLAEAVLHIQDKDVKSDDFARLLDLLYPRTYGHVRLMTLEEWLSVLQLTTKWSFTDLRALSIRHLDALPKVSPIDKLLAGRTYDVPHWISEAYVALCERATQLTLDECRQLSLEDVVNVNNARHEARVRFHAGVQPIDKVRAIVERILRPPPALGSDVAEEADVGATSPPKDSSVIEQTATPRKGPKEPRTLQPPDFAQIIAMIKQYVAPSGIKQNSESILALEKLIRPHCNQAEVMSKVAKVIVDELPESRPDLFAMSSFMVLGETLLDLVGPLCGGTAQEPNQQLLRGKPWLARCMVTHCYAGCDTWKISTPKIEFLAWLNDTEHLADDAFEALWLKLIDHVRQPQSAWSLELIDFFDQNNGNIQTPANSTHSARFFEEVQKKSDGHDPIECSLNCRYHLPLPGTKPMQCCIPQTLLSYKLKSRYGSYVRLFWPRPC